MSEQKVEFRASWERNEKLYLREELATIHEPRKMEISISGVTLIVIDAATGGGSTRLNYKSQYVPL